jgi:hypothetical protein
LFHLVFESHTGRALVPSPKRSASPRATSTHCNVDSPKVLDPEPPIREADKDRSGISCSAKTPDDRWCSIAARGKINTSQVVAVSQKIDFSHVAADITEKLLMGEP